MCKERNKKETYSFPTKKYTEEVTTFGGNVDENGFLIVNWGARGFHEYKHAYTGTIDEDSVIQTKKNWINMNVMPLVYKKNIRGKTEYTSLSGCLSDEI